MVTSSQDELPPYIYMFRDKGCHNLETLITIGIKSCIIQF
jgi:hypothetical protein